MEAPEGTTELGIDIIKVDRIRDALGALRRPLPEAHPDRRRARLRPRPAREPGRPLGGQGGREQGARPRRPGRGLARDRDRAPAHRPADRRAPRPGPAARRPAGHEPHRGVHQPRAGVRGGHRVRHPDPGWRVRVPGGHRGAPRRPRAPDPGAHARVCATWSASARAIASADGARERRTSCHEPRPPSGRPDRHPARRRPGGAVPARPTRRRAQGHVRARCWRWRLARLGGRGAAGRDRRAARRCRAGDPRACRRPSSRSSRAGCRSS